MILERDLRLVIGGAAMKKYGRLVRVTRIPRLGGEEMLEAVARAATTASHVNPRGWVNYAGPNVPRIDYIDVDGDGIRETPVWVTENSKANLCGFSEAINSWTKAGTPVVTDGAISIGDLTLALCADDDAAVIEKVSRSVTLTGDTVKAWSFFVAVGTSPPPTSSFVKLNDVTAGNVGRFQADISFAAGVPSLTNVTVGTVLKVEFYGYTVTGLKVYRVHCQSTSVTAASTHIVEMWPAGRLQASDTGNIYFGGSQVEDEAIPSSYVKTPTGANVTRLGEITSPISFYNEPQAISVYVALQERGILSILSSGFHRVLQIGSGGAGTTVLNVRRQNDQTPKRYNTAHEDGDGTHGVSVTPSASAAAAYLDFVEILTQLGPDGSIRVMTSLNKGAIDNPNPSGAKALRGSWASPQVYVGGAGGVPNGSHAIHAVAIANGSYAMDEFRREFA